MPICHAVLHQAIPNGIAPKRDTARNHEKARLFTKMLGAVASNILLSSSS